MDVVVLEMSTVLSIKRVLKTSHSSKASHASLPVRESEIRESFACGIRNPNKFVLVRIWNPGHWNPEYKFRWQQIRNQVPENRNPWHRIKKPRLSWIPSHGRRLIKPKKVVSTESKAAKVRYHMHVTLLSIPYLLASQSPSNLPWPPQVLFLQRICLRWHVGMRAPLKQFNFALCCTRAGPHL